MRIKGAAAPPDWYEQFGAWGPSFTGGATPFPVRSEGEARSVRYAYGDDANGESTLESTLVTLVNMTWHRALTSVPFGRGDREAVVEMFHVIAMPEENAAKLLSLAQPGSIYPSWVKIAAKGNCQREQSFPKPMRDAIGRPLDARGKIAEDSKLVAVERMVETCRHLDCPHHKQHAGGPPISLAQAYRYLAHVEEPPKHPMDSSDLQPSEDLLRQIALITEVDRRMQVGDYALQTIEFIRKREAAVRQMENSSGKVVKWGAPPEDR